MTRNKVIAAVVALLIVAGVGWYWVSPAYAMSRLKEAAVSGDKEQLEERIDFPKVRESLKMQFRALMAAEIAKPENQSSGFAKFGAMLGMAMVDPMVDGFVTPDSLSAMIKQGKMAPAEKTAAANTPPAEKSGGLADWTIERHGLSRFTATPKVPQGEKVPTMVFERDGLGWKLVEIDIPADAVPTTAR